MAVDLVPHSGMLGGVPESIRAEGAEIPLAAPEGLSRRARQKAPRTATVRFGDRTVVVSLRGVMPSFRGRLRFALGGQRRRLPLTILAYALSAGLGSGAAGAASSTVAWLIYELTVDGESYGCWVATAVDGLPRSWQFVAAGDALPEPDWLNWPTARRPTAASSN